MKRRATSDPYTLKGSTMSKFYTITLPVALSAKKGDTQAFFLGIRQNSPSPCIASDWSHPWQGLETLDPSTYRNAEGVRMSPTFSGFLLWRGKGLEHNNADLAGKHGKVDGKPVVRPSPVFRGQACGEVKLTYDLERNRIGKANGWTHPAVDVSCDGTASARDWLKDQLSAPFLEAIRANREALHRAAVDYVRDAFREGVQRLRDDADKREQEAADILARIESQPIANV